MSDPTQPEQQMLLKAQLEQLKTELDAIQQRNHRVEQDKAWETSKTRVFFLLAITYLTTTLVFWLIHAPAPLLNALIPTVGYGISIQSLPFVKSWWLSRKTANQSTV